MLSNADLTGEENEDLEQEIKGVKLFVKRGDKPFSDGMPGHLKLLSDKTTLDQRLCKWFQYGRAQRFIGVQCSGVNLFGKSL